MNLPWLICPVSLRAPRAFAPTRSSRTPEPPTQITNTAVSPAGIWPRRADFAWSADAMRATFVLSNAVPQYRNPNSGRWSQLEAEVRRIAANADFALVFTGPIFDEANVEYIGEGRVAVPSHTFKVVLAVRGDSKTMYAAIVPNKSKISEPLSEFVTTVQDVERRTGLDFFASLEDEEERRLESSRGARVPKSR